ncbi:FISUMP domain-containing protein [Fibrobacter sp.]|uniref:FISUMP domain-containing protein n=1 Tax=Fibrobacter sp. TaxID=35828 RepID=UPI003866CD4F
MKIFTLRHSWPVILEAKCRESILLAMALVFAVFTACDSGSSSTDPDSIAEVSSSSDDDAISSSSVTDKGTSSGGSSKSSSSVKPDSNGSQKKSSSSVQPNSSEGKTVSSSSNNGQNGSSSSSRYKTCTSEKEGVEAYISQEQSWCICTDGFWIPMSSSSVTPSSSSKYYDMSRLFVSENDYSYGEFTDPRDGQVYKTIRYEVGYKMIDSLTFFAQNLNYGKMIPGGTQMTDSTKFCYDDDPWYCENGFGGLYTWATVMNFPAACDSFAMGSAKCPVEYDLMSNPFPEYQDRLSFAMHQGICPEGWHVMNQEEWAMVLIGSGSRDGASYLGAVLWGSGNQRGFSLLPAGILETQRATSSNEKNVYTDIKKYALHWIPGEYSGSGIADPSASYGKCVTIASDRMDRTAGIKKVYGLSVRCVQDY